MSNDEFNIENNDINDWLFEYKNATDEKTRERLKKLIIMTYLPLVNKIARSLARRSNDPVEDIIQVGSIGLLKAVDLFHSSKNTSFKTYATYLITGEIRHYLRDRVSMIKAPREIRELSYRVHKITLELAEKLGAMPTDEQLAQEFEALQVNPKKIEAVIDLDRRTNTISIDQIDLSASGDNQEGTILDKIPDIAQIEAQKFFEDRILLKEAINSLDDIEKKIVTMNFYEGLNQREIANALKISPMQVSRKMKKALNKLFEFVKQKGLDSYD